MNKKAKSILSVIVIISFISLLVIISSIIAELVISDTVLNSTSGNNLTTDNLTVYYTSNGTSGNFTDWRKNDVSIAVLNMPFDNNISTNNTGAIIDYSTYGNNGTLGGGNISRTPTWNASGKIGGAYSFDGVDDYVNTPVNLNWTQGSIGVWAKPSDLNERNLFVYTADDGISSYTHQAGFISTGKVHVYICEGAAKSFDSVATVSAGNWYHIVIIWKNNDKLKLYVNGIFDNQTNIGVAWASGNKFLIGKDAGTSSGLRNHFNGSIDEVQIYNYSLSPEQIYANYIAGNESHSNNILVAEETTAGDNWTALVGTCDDVNCTTNLSNVVLINPSSCVGATTSFVCGETITESCTLNGNVSIDGATCFTIGVNNTIIDGAGYTIDGNDAADTAGIHVYGKTNVTIQNTIITDFENGIVLEVSSNNTLTNNTATSNSVRGLLLYDSSNNNTLTNNTATSNNYGFVLYSNSNNNTLTNNTATSTINDGFFIDVNSNNNIFINNTNELAYSGASRKFYSTTAQNTTSSGNIGWFPLLASNGSDAIVQANNAWYNGSSGGRNANGSTNVSLVYWFNNTPFTPRCVGATTSFVCGETITESCTMNGNLTTTGTCFTIGANDLVVNCAGNTILGIANNTIGITFGALTNTTIKNCIFSSNYSNSRDNIFEGIYGTGSDKNTTIFNNTFLNNTRAIRFDAFLDSVNVSNNTLTNGEVAMILWGEQGTNYANVTIADNNATNFNTSYYWNAMINIRYINNNFYMYNNFFKSGDYPSNIEIGWTNNSKIYNNTFIGGTKYINLRMGYDVYNSHIFNNTIQYGTDGILLNGINNTIENNTIKDSIHHNVILYVSPTSISTSDNIIANNTLTNVTYNGVCTGADGDSWIGKIENNRYIGNNITGAGSYGIYLKWSGITPINETIENNWIKENTNGIYLSDGNHTIINNTIIESGSGMYAVGSYLNISFNNISKCNTGILLGGTYNFLQDNIILDSVGNGISFGTSNHHTILRNIINNATTGIQMGSSTSYSMVTNHSIIDTVVSNCSDYSIYGARRTAGDRITANNSLLNVTTNKSQIIVEGNAILYIKWYLDTYVNDTSGNSVEGAFVTAYDNTNALTFNITTNSSGYIERQNVTEYYQTSSGKTYYTNYSVNASIKGFISETDSVNITDNYIAEDLGQVNLTLNSLPTISNVHLSSEYYNDDISCLGTYSDLENDAEDGSTYRWFVNNILQSYTSKMINKNTFYNGESVKCEYTPCNSFNCGNAVNSTAKILTHDSTSTYVGSGGGGVSSGALSNYTLVISYPSIIYEEKEFNISVYGKQGNTNINLTSLNYSIDERLFNTSSMLKNNITYYITLKAKQDLSGYYGDKTNINITTKYVNEYKTQNLVLLVEGTSVSGEGEKTILQKVKDIFSQIPLQYYLMFGFLLVILILIVLNLRRKR